MVKIFINYAKEDAEKANKLYEDLKSNSDTKLWIDKDSLLAGCDWDLEIKKAIWEARYFIALLSECSTTKMGVVHLEIREAIKKMNRLPQEQTFILPVRLEECKSSFPELNEKQYVDMFPDWDDGLERLLKVFSESHSYLGRIARAKRIVASIDDTMKNCKKRKKSVIIRMRATWTSMSNIAHYKGKDIKGLFAEQANKLDNLLVEERELLTGLLDLKCVKLKCICNPLIKFLSDVSYSLQEKEERRKYLTAFLKNSLSEHVDRHEVLYDKAGAYGNQLLIGSELAITANPKSGGYTRTSVFDDRQVVDVLIREYDHLFKRIRQSKFLHNVFSSVDGQNKLLLYETLLAVNKESTLIT